VARTTTEVAISDDERVEVLAAFDKTFCLEARILHDCHEILFQPLSIGNTGNGKHSRDHRSGKRPHTRGDEP